MKKIITTFCVMVIMSTIHNAQAQFNPYADEVKLLSAGLGISGWGIPLYVRFEAPVADNITIGGSLSFQSKSESYTGASWNHTIFGLVFRGSYHFNELLEINDKWDLYAGLGLGYYFWETKYEGTGTGTYTGSGNGGLSLGLHIGGRYFVTDKLGLNLEVGGGTVLGGGTIGVTFLL